MSKILKITLSIIGLLLFYLWICSTFQSCQNKKTNTDDIALVNDTLDDDEELLESLDEESFEDDEIDYSDEDSEISDNEFVEFDDSESNSTSSSSNSTTASTNSSRTNYSSNSRGQYLVISGNYLVDTNAEKMKSKLKNMGFTNAEIAVFNGSNYQTVIANRYSDYSEAVEAASTLKQKGIDSYVKKKS